MEHKCTNNHARSCLFLQEFVECTKHVTCPVRVQFRVLLKKSHKAFDHGPDAIPGTLPVSRSACFPYNSSSPDGSLELEERVHGKLVFEVRRGSVSIEVHALGSTLRSLKCSARATHQDNKMEHISETTTQRQIQIEEEPAIARYTKYVSWE